MKEKKAAKFFCESCGSEVPKNAKFCPVCGKFFASVRCPQCGKIGSVSEFKNGCSICGYAMHSKLTNVNSKKESYDKIKINQNDSSLPIWIYICTFFVLIILVIMLYSCLK